MNAKPIIAIAVLAAAGTLAYRTWGDKLNPGKRKDHKLYGNVDIRQVDLSFRIAGRLATVTREEGEAVKAGQIIATLEGEPFEQALNQALARKKIAQAKLEKLRRGFRPEEIDQTRARLQQWKANIRAVESEQRRRNALIEDGAVTKQSLDNVAARKAELEAGLQTTQAALALQEAGYREEDIQAGRAALEEAEAGVAAARINLADTELKAPADGIILTRVGEPGAVVGPGQPIYGLSLTQPVWIRTYIEEPRLGHIEPGQEVSIHTDSRPDHPYRGHIGYISPKAEFTPKTVQTESLRTNLVYRVRVVVDGPGDGLRQGMPVTLTLGEAQRKHTEDQP